MSIPIKIKLIDTSHLYQSHQNEYPQIMIEPSLCHYPQFINSPINKQTVYTILSDSKQPISKPFSFLNIFCCCK